MVAKGKELTKKDKDKREKREYREMVKKVEGYKRVVSALAKFFMGISMMLTMADILGFSPEHAKQHAGRWPLPILC